MRGKSVNEKTKPNKAKLQPIKVAFGGSVATERFESKQIKSNEKPETKQRLKSLTPLGNHTSANTNTNIFNFASSKIPYLLNKNHFINKPSQIYQVERASPFSMSNKHKTNFGFAYSSGSIPCRITHGNVKLTLKWDREVVTLDYDPLLVTCFEGLLETDHPYNFVSRECIKNLLSADKAYEKTTPLLNKIIVPIRNAICSNTEFLDNMTILTLLSDLVKEALNPYLHLIVQQLGKNMIHSQYKERIVDLLRTFEVNGGKESFKIIKKKIPTYLGL